MKANLFEKETFYWPQYINGNLLRQIFANQNENSNRQNTALSSRLKIETPLFTSIDTKYIAFVLNNSSVDYYLVVLQRRLDRTTGKRKEKKNIDTFYEALSKNQSPSLPGSFVQSYKGKVTYFFSMKDSSNLLLYVITANGVVNIWSPEQHATKTWEHLLSFALSEYYISKSLCSIPSQIQSETVLWLESGQRVTPTVTESDEFIRLRRVVFEYDIEGKTIKLSAPMSLLDISRVSFFGGIRPLVFAGGIWLVPTLVGTHCSITVHLFSTSRTISMDIPVGKVVDENDAVISFGGHSEGIGGSNTIYVIISSYIYRVKYSESEGLQCQSFALSDASIHGNTIQSVIVVMESIFCLIFCAVLNNGAVIMCRVILKASSFRSTPLICLTLSDTGAMEGDSGICITGDNEATSCRGFTVYIQSILVWNGFQVSRITPSSPNSWIDLDFILSVRTLSKCILLHCIYCN